MMHLWLSSILAWSPAATRFLALSSDGMRKGVTFSIFFQKGSMSTTRSFKGLWLASGSMVISPIFLYSGMTCRLHARRAKPFTFMAQEPQMAERQDFLNDSVGSSSDILMRASSTVIPSVTSTG